MAVSTIPTAKLRLLNAIVARPALAGVLVRWSVPASSQAQRDRIFVAEARNIDREWAGLGATRLEERYTVDIVCETFWQGDNAQSAEERLWTIVGEVDGAIRTDVTLAGLVIEAKPSMSDQELGPADEDNWLARVTVHVDCRARI